MVFLKSKPHGHLHSAHQTLLPHGHLNLGDLWDSVTGYPLKCYKPLPVIWQGAEEMGQMELLLNVYASSKARGSIADFMGHCTVDPEEATYRLTPGLWLVRPPLPSNRYKDLRQRMSRSASLPGCVCHLLDHEDTVPEPD